MMRIVVGVIRGGTSSEYNLSLKTGAELMRALPEEKYDVRDILIDKEGYWHSRGVTASPMRILSQLDVVLNALHGGIGEDGTVQRLFERAGVRHTGARAMPSGMALNKVQARRILAQAGIKMPRAVGFGVQPGLHTGEMARHVFANFGPPYIVKPVNDGAGAGIRVARTISELPEALADVLDSYGAALVEEYVRGEEASVGVVDAFRNEPHYVLPPAHVVRDGAHLQPHHHESASIRHFVPSNFSYTEKQSLADIVRRAHIALGLHHFSRSDLIVAAHGIYLLEVNAIPGLYPGASFPKMLEAVGSSVGDFAEHSIRLALGRA
jgi:D-alanine-D-alanine ligase